MCWKHIMPRYCHTPLHQTRANNLLEKSPVWRTPCQSVSMWWNRLESKKVLFSISEKNGVFGEKQQYRAIQYGRFQHQPLIRYETGHRCGERGNGAVWPEFQWWGGVNCDYQISVTLHTGIAGIPSKLSYWMESIFNSCILNNLCTLCTTKRIILNIKIVD